MGYGYGAGNGMAPLLQKLRLVNGVSAFLSASKCLQEPYIMKADCWMENWDGWILTLFMIENIDENFDLEPWYIFILLHLPNLIIPKWSGNRLLDKSKGFWSLGRDCRAFTECWR
jgi:hypothetical protein